MREILFRGKRADNGEWIYGNFVSGIFFRGEKKEDVPYIMTGDYIDYDCFGFMSATRDRIDEYVKTFPEVPTPAPPEKEEA